MQETPRRAPPPVPPDAGAVYARALRALNLAHARFLLGGAWCMAELADVRRTTKDIDLFVLPGELEHALAALAAEGFHTEVVSRDWLAKAWRGGFFVDLIFSSGNGIATVDEDWFAHAVPGVALEEPVLFCPAEETVWSKAWIMERERFDGADVAHLLRACGEGLDWARLLARFGPHWHVLFGHLVLFDYIYPGERGRVPDWVRRELAGRYVGAGAPGPDRVCRGPLLSRQFAHDVEELGYAAPDTRGPR